MNYFIFGLMVVSTAFSNEMKQFEYAPIFYHSRTVSNAVSSLNGLESTSLVYDPGQGYLKSVLTALDISPTSQILVFDSTSFQRHRIGVKTPRALYFNETDYVGWVPDGDIIEITSLDPFLGPVFYTLSQDPAVEPLIKRNNADCLRCHSSAKTQSVPGLQILSAYQSIGGRFKNVNVDHRTPLEERWGGWYVTGQTGAVNHQGNLPQQREVATEAHLNRLDLSAFFNTTHYLTPHSDLMALMVLEHQCQMLNLITRANYRVRLILHDHKIDPADSSVDYPERVRFEVGRNADAIVRYMLFSDEAKLDGDLSGSSGFSACFTASGIRDEQGRSLRDFDGRHRLFKYPCSYLIYSASFQSLPVIVKQAVYQKLHMVLLTNDSGEGFSHLTASDKKAIYEILKSTLPDVPENWK